MTATKATLAGMPIAGSAGWKFTRGVTPYQRVFEFRPDFADSILKNTVSRFTPGESVIPGNTSTVELRIEPVGHPSLVVKNLSVLAAVPASQPYLKALLVTDVRWLWPKKVISKSYNVRRKSGDRAILSETNGGNLEINFILNGVVDDITYAPYSLTPAGLPWTVSEILEDVLGYVTGGQYDMSLVDKSILPPIVEGVTFDGEAGPALGQLLSMLNLNIFINRDGVATLSSQFDRSESLEIGKSGYQVVGTPGVTLSELNRVRPSYIEVSFNCEDEVRFDFFDPVVPATGDRLNPPRILENVIELPDAFLKIGDKTFIQGTYVPFNQALLDAWNTQNPPNILNNKLPNLTFELIRNQWLTEWPCYKDTDVLTDPVWSRRMGAVKQHYRQTFRIPHAWISRAFKISAVRSAIINQETATRARARVYADWSEIPTQRRLAREKQDPATALVVNHVGFAADLKDAKPAQADVQIVDEEQGIFRVVYKNDAYGSASKVIPSLVVLRSDAQARPGTPPTQQNLPTYDPRFNCVVLDTGALSSVHQLAVVFTFVTASPNSEGRLYNYKVKPEDISDVLPKATSKESLGECFGPPLQIRVGPGVDTARFAWLDSESQNIVNSIIFGTPRDSNRLVNREDIENVSKAVAAATYLNLLDRFEGSLTTAFDPERVPVGRISTVSHELEANGRALTTMDLPPDIRPFDFYNLLPESTRRILLRLVKDK